MVQCDGQWNNPLQIDKKATLTREFTSAFLYAAQAWRSLARKKLIQEGIRADVASALFWIAEVGDGAKQIEVASRMGFTAPSLVRMIDLLETLGHVRREVDQYNRRANHLWLTPQGRLLVNRIQTILDDLRRQVLGNFDVQQLSMTTSILQSMVASLVQSD